MLLKARKSMQILTPPPFFPTVTIEKDQGLSKGQMIPRCKSPDVQKLRGYDVPWPDLNVWVQGFVFFVLV